MSVYGLDMLVYVREVDRKIVLEEETQNDAKLLDLLDPSYPPSFSSICVFLLLHTTHPWYQLQK